MTPLHFIYYNGPMSFAEQEICGRCENYGNLSWDGRKKAFNWAHSRSFPKSLLFCSKYIPIKPQMLPKRINATPAVLFRVGHSFNTISSFVLQSFPNSCFVFVKHIEMNVQRMNNF